MTCRMVEHPDYYLEYANVIMRCSACDHEFKNEIDIDTRYGLHDKDEGECPKCGEDDMHRIIRFA